MKHKTREMELGMVIADRDCFITAQCWGYYDPGRPFGPIETSYPPEGEFEAYDIKIVDEETNEVIQFETLSKKDQERIEVGLEENYFEADRYDSIHGGPDEDGY